MRDSAASVSEKVDRTERKQALLRAARDVFAEKGYHDAKVEDIAEKAKVAKGTVYLYFKDKRGVLEELVNGLFLRLGMAIVRVDVGEEVASQVVHNIRAIVNVFFEDLPLTRVLLSYAAGLDPAFVKKIGSFYESGHNMLRAALQEGQRLGIVAPGDADVYATFTLGALKEILFEAATKRRVRTREEIVSELFKFLDGGYLRVPPADPRKSPAGARRAKGDTGPKT